MTTFKTPVLADMLRQMEALDAQLQHAQSLMPQYQRAVRERDAALERASALDSENAALRAQLAKYQPQDPAHNSPSKKRGRPPGSHKLRHELEIALTGRRRPASADDPPAKRRRPNDTNEEGGEEEEEVEEVGTVVPPADPIAAELRQRVAHDYVLMCRSGGASPTHFTKSAHALQAAGLLDATPDLIAENIRKHHDMYRRPRTWTAGLIGLVSDFIARQDQTLLASHLPRDVAGAACVSIYARAGILIPYDALSHLFEKTLTTRTFAPHVNQPMDYTPCVK